MPDSRAGRIVLRSCSAIAGALALASLVLAFCPGVEHITEDGLEIAAVAGDPVWVLGPLILMMALMVDVWRKPYLGRALLWSLVSAAGTVFVMAGSQSHSFDYDTVRRVLWTVPVYEAVVLWLVVLLIAVLPLACGGIALVEWLVRRAARPPAPEPFARARVHRIGRA